MSLVNSLAVTYHGHRVGTLTMAADGQRCAFQYNKAWIADGFSISPLDLPLRDELFIAQPTPFWGNFGIFEDSLPDGYGRYLLNRILHRRGIDDMQLSPIDRLSIVGSGGMGALCYEPERMVGESKSLPSFDTLQQMALDVLGEKSDADADVLYFNSGNSGGCRPKCLYTDSEGHWLVKFRHTYDPHDIGAMELRYNEAARHCGIVVPDFKLIDGRYFATRRFDITPQGERLHVATAGALLNESIHVPKLDYRTLLQLTGFLTQSPAQVEQMFRRMVFNVLAQNKDDHAKNFAFICRDGNWELTPAYDLTHSPQGYNGEHATSVCNAGNPTEADMIAAATAIRIPRKRAETIINEIKNTIFELLQVRS